MCLFYCCTQIIVNAGAYNAHPPHSCENDYICKKQKPRGEDVEKLEPLCTVSGKVKWCRHCGHVRRVLKALTMELPCDLATPVLGRACEKERMFTCKPVHKRAQQYCP